MGVNWIELSHEMRTKWNQKMSKTQANQREVPYNIQVWECQPPLPLTLWADNNSRGLSCHSLDKKKKSGADICTVSMVSPSQFVMAFYVKINKKHYTSPCGFM